MNVKLRKIEVDAETADLLEARAAARHMTVSELIADLASNQEALPADLAEMRSKREGPWSPEVLAEDARRLAEFERTREGVPWDEVKSWLRSWGTPDELPTPKPRRL
jgi:predicted transcriptional regulator